MRFLVATIVLIGLCGQANAQGKSKKPQPQQPSTRYLSFSEGSLDGSATYLIDGVLKLTSQGSQITDASIDVCYPTSTLSRRVDRLVIPLKADGANFSGAGASSAGDRVAVSIKRSGSKDEQQLNGSLKLPDHSVAIAATGLTFSEEDPTALPSGSTAEDETEDVSDKPVPDPGTLSVTTKLPNVVDLVKLVRTEGARMDPAGLVPNCADLRGGTSSISIDVDPERAPALLEKVKKLPGVATAEYGQVADKSQLVKLKAKPGDADLIAALGRALPKAIPDATIVSSGKDAGRGEIQMALTRKVSYLDPMGAQEAISLRATAWQDPQDKSVSYVQLRGVDARLVDTGKEKVFSVGPAESEGEDAVVASDLDTATAQQAIAAALASDLHGQIWAEDAWVSK
ncbi:hypothetical protein [Methylobacterium sp. yr668]|uniref:hypothetical protein n=1 Tax=Methylobacterium sp. yr668 TaxID=1761801 RepID=UPI0008EB4FD1|nr:hypothetical protein [Methylobacterium sp. yr668]SFT30682.1 hypothetical protein SAMN04487845_1862 [Methylobacterium sp. yr668]